MNEDRKPAAHHPAPQPAPIDQRQQGTTKPDQGGEAELTEKEERKRDGANKTAPGPIYDV